MTHALYRDIVLEHRRAPRNFGALPGHTDAADGVNALCGDRVRIELRREADRIRQLSFQGESCAIATASASMMSLFVAGRGLDEIAEAAQRFERLVRGEALEDASLGDLQAFAELRNYPSRRKCALLPWSTLLAALAGGRSASTEDPLSG